MGARTYKIIPWILPFLLALAAFAVSRFETAEILERRLLDVRFQLRGSRSVLDTPLQVVIVDDQSFDALDVKWPFRGSLYARLIQNLNRAGARLIVFDIEFTEPDAAHPREDSIFAAAVSEAGNVILAGKFAYTYSDKFEAPFMVQVQPHAALLKTGAPWGLVNEITDSDDFTRRSLLYLHTEDYLKPSLDLEVLRALGNSSPDDRIIIAQNVCRFGEFEIELYDEQSFLINYYGPAGTFPGISFSSVLDDSTFDLDPNFDSDYMEQFLIHDSKSISVIKNPFAGKIVLIGVSAEELHDNKNTPFYSLYKTPRRMPGVEVHANALQTILDGSFITRISPLMVLLYSVILAYLIFILFTLFKMLKGFLASLLVIIPLFVTTFLIFSWWNLWLDLVAPVLTAGFTYLGISLHNYYRESREKARIRDMFSHYVPESVVDEIVSKPELLKLGGERRVLSILFSDIEGFTSLSETLAPEKLVDHLNEYMSMMTAIIQENGGIIDKYEGDLIMAEFGVPLPSPDHAERASKAALKMRQTLAMRQNEWLQSGKPEFPTRIGVNTGEVIVGNMGSNDLFDYTVLGDTVNVCSRLEKANKLFQSGIIISQATNEALPEHFVTRRLGKIKIHGREEAVAIYQLLAENSSDLKPPMQDLLELYKEGWANIERSEWGKAMENFIRVLELNPQDEPARIIYTRLASLKSRAVSSNPVDLFRFEIA